MTKGQSNRHSKLKARRVARRASAIVEIHKADNVAKAKMKADKWATCTKTPRGTARAARRAAAFIGG